MGKDNGPRISVNKLAECMSAKAGRKRQILRDQKYPDFKGMYYREATEAVSLCLASGLEDTTMLSKAVKLLEQAPAGKTGTLRRLNSNIDAIEAFESMLDTIDLKGGNPELGENRPEKLTFHGVEVSVRPEIVLRGHGKMGKPMVGALKVHFSKTFTLDAASAGIVSAVLQRYAEDKISGGDEIVGSQYCFVIDVGSKAVYPAAKSITARLKDVEAECQNIAALWPTITPDE